MRRDHSRLLAALSAEYAARFPRSGELAARAERVMVDGGSHGFRLTRPFPVRISGARGAYLRDVELSHRVLHLALLLEDVYLLYGCCAASTAHTEADMERLRQACAAAGRRIGAYL